MRAPVLTVRLRLFAAFFAWLCPGHGWGFGFFDGTGLTRGSRWDTTPRVMSGMERSLNGGLRYSLQGGSFTAYRDLLSWQGTVPSAASFEQAVREAFALWTVTDPATGLGTPIQFVPDLSTAVSTSVSGFVRFGAEIDIFASTDGGGWNPGNTGTRAETFFSSISVSGNLRLTSGTTGYAGFAISGADVTFNSNPGALYTLTSFRTILAHEIGHALGLADVDALSGPNGTFVDDNYTPATAATSLMNSFALRINHLNPGASALSLYTVANGVPGFDTPGVNILMETSIPSVYFGPGLTLAADDYAGRQFLYPVAPPPPPDLTARLTASEIVLRWNEVPAWKLQVAPGPSGPWLDSADQGGVAAGFREVVIPTSSARRFFRLNRSL